MFFLYVSDAVSLTQKIQRRVLYQSIAAKTYEQMFFNAAILILKILDASISNVLTPSDVFRIVRVIGETLSQGKIKLARASGDFLVPEVELVECYYIS